MRCIYFLDHFSHQLILEVGSDHSLWLKGQEYNIAHNNFTLHKNQLYLVMRIQWDEY